MAIQSASKKTMREYLNDIYYIPMNQRDYTWEAEQIEDFWQDLLSVLTHRDRQHFFGQVVVYNDGVKKKKFIIDGQQRTVTSMIFLRSIQYLSSELRQKTEDERQRKGLKDLDSSLTQILGYDGNGYDDHSQLHLTFESEINENDYFSTFVINGAPTSEKVKNRPACENMRNAYYYFYRKLKEVMDESDMDGKIHALYDYRNSFLDNFEVMYLETNDLGESYVIFETLNARGKDLETADLLKNYVFSQAQGNLNDVQEKWKKMTDSLGGLDLTKYIRYYWNARYGLVREKDLYREISANIRTPKESKDLVTDLKDNAEYYHDACVPDSCDAYDDKEIIDRLLAIRTLKATSFIPILLALEMRKDAFSVKDKAAILRAIEVYVFRNATIAGKTANSTETFFSSIAHNIYEQKLISVNEIVKTIKSEMISDEDFKNSFCTFATKTQPYIRYILLSIHEYLDANHEINRNPQEVNIEHIMPKTITDSWPGIDNETHEKYLWRLGNLALLDDKLNKKASNQSFKEKQKIYKESLIKPNQDLAVKYTEWGPKQIEERQKNLAEIALQIWR
jgi:uncharacterized protein with ParB-like and HNH nuclease domain